LKRDRAADYFALVRQPERGFDFPERYDRVMMNLLSHRVGAANATSARASMISLAPAGILKRPSRIARYGAFVA
jgi:hypothetical protein